MEHSTARVFLSAGEASGDHYGAEIISQLRAMLGSVHAFGLGGKAMEDAGQERIVRAEDVAVMGITEVIRHMPRIYGEYRKLLDAIRRQKPDVAVLIDFPDVNLRLAEKLHELGVPVIYFVSPQLWAWKRKRIEKVRRFVTKMLVIFPFEESFYRNRGIDAEFVGHPLAELPAPEISREEFAAINEIDPAKPWIALLPGSRMREVRHNLPVMLETAHTLGSQYEFLFPVASTLSTETVLETMQAMHAAAAENIHLVNNARAALYHSRAGIVASGTATVQAAVIGNPFLAVYRVSALTYAMAKRLVRYPAEIPATRDASGNLPVAMANLIATGIEPGLRVVPELLQDNFNATNVIAQLQPLLAESQERSRMMQQLQRVKQALHSRGNDSISQVCNAVVQLLPQSKAPA